MSKATPWVKWFPGDFLHGISDLETNEIVVYVIVLNLIYDKQAPWPYNAKRLAKRCGLRLTVVEEVVKALISYEKLALTDGALTNEKAEKVIGKRQEVSAAAAAAANARWAEENGKDNENKDSDDAFASDPQCGTDANQRPEARDQKLEEEDTSLRSAEPTPPVVSPEPVDENPLAEVTPGTSLVAAKQKMEAALGSAPSKADVQTAFELYQVMAKKEGLPVARALDEARRAAISRILKTYGADVWVEAIERTATSDLLRGLTGRGWKSSLDWMTKPANFKKIVEGNYNQSGDDRRGGANGQGTHRSRHEQNARDAFDAAQELFGRGPDDDFSRQ